ncbi:spore germination protein [Eubacterium sp.]|uniref:spore germination protein n=1 Tax=Eubacterium sp. TaxID=142586 RepID=UPI003F04B63A
MQKLYSDYELNLLTFKDDFKDSSDFLIKELCVGNKRLFVACMDGLVNSLSVSQMIVEPIFSVKNIPDDSKDYLDMLKKSIVHCPEQNTVDTFDDAYYYLMSGFAVVIVEDCRHALAFGVQGWNKRTTDEPSNENNVKGARECFVESANDNKALLRKRLKTYHLKQKQINLGTSAKTPVIICYIDDRADKGLVSQIEKRLKQESFNSVLDYGELLPFIDTDISSLFSCVGTTERPDVLASKLLEGRVAVMVEGTPFVMYTPYLFSDNFSSLDDYDNPPFYSSFMRILKYGAFIISVFLPGMFVAVGTFHQELIPSNMLFLIASNEATTPFSLMAEAVFVHLLYEIMREAGLRLPKSIGHAISIIGAIIIGDAAVSAGIIGAPMLIIIAATAISSYVIYPLYERLAVIRIGFIILGGVFGIYGIMLGAAMMFCNICAINPFGVAYSSPLSPLTEKSLVDVLVRGSWKKLAKRRVRVSDFEGATLDE